MKDRKKFAATMMGLSETYNRPVSKSVMDIWWQVFERYDDEVFAKAVMSHITDTSDAGKFFPTPADILRRLEGKTSERALGAWVKLMEGVGRVGSWGTPAFDDPFIHMVVIDMGGWGKICAVKQDELPFVMQEFQKRYEEKYNSAKDGRTKVTYPALYGAINQERLLSNLEPEQPTMIGDGNRVAELLFKKSQLDLLANSVNDGLTVKRIQP